jgi:DNA-directed RNA polymerase subunit H (RpoH/RPB5)
MRNLNRGILFAAALTMLSLPALSMEPTATPPQQRPAVNRKVRHHRHYTRWNPVFRPSRESLILQNAEVDRMDLPRIQDDDELEALKEKGELVEIQASEHLRFDPRLDPDRRYCRPWTRDFLEDLGKAYFEAFGTSIQVNSAVRTVKIQKKLRRHNRNAAPEKGELASSHLAGTTVDIQRRGLTPAQIKWMQQYMLPLKELGLIEPEEERRQWVFHVMVSDHYGQARDEKSDYAERQPTFHDESEARSEWLAAQ